MAVCCNCFGATFAAPELAQSQTFPSRPVTIVVPFPAVGPTDALARVLSERMKGFLSQPVIMENVTGAAGTTGVGRVVRAAPDGNTITSALADACRERRHLYDFIRPGEGL